MKRAAGMALTRAWAPPPFNTQARWLQAVDALGLPLTWGLVCGVALDYSAVAYFIGCGIAAAGGLSAGLQHPRITGALARGLTGGTVFALSILLGHALAGSHPTGALPHPEALQLPLSIVPGMLLGAAAKRISRARGTRAAADVR